MPTLTESLAAWGKDNFSSILKNELQELGPKKLPLEKGTSQGGYIDESPISVTVNNFTDRNNTIKGSVGVFFTEIVINCGCGDDPMHINAYCDLAVAIDKQTAIATFSIINE